MSKKDYAIHWFRRDLRVAGNPALSEVWKSYDGRVVGVFCFDHKFLDRSDFGVHRFQFFLQSLKSLRDELRSIGSDLLFLDVGPSQTFPDLLQRLSSSDWGRPECISWNRDYEPFARTRDEHMKSFLDDQGIKYCEQRDHVLIEPHELEKKEGGGYQVYSPFSRQWIDLFSKPEIQERLKRAKKGIDYLTKLAEGKNEKIFSLQWKDLLDISSDQEKLLQSYIDQNQKRVSIKIPEAGSKAALYALQSFEPKLHQYQEKRDIPSIEGTSGFSNFLKNGSLTISMIIAFYDLKAFEKKDRSGEAVFFRELIWREFYYHILYRHPNVEGEAFLPKYRDLKWENDPKKFQAWKEGKTGFPIVDAGMRQLAKTGWMHNRVRMIVASFLTKDLLIDWRWGEQYFMEQLLDGDLAPNNGGWQWAASTGCDPQPYFRIFNPWSQAKKFDPEGRYVKTYVEELAKVSNECLFDPEKLKGKYIAPIVDHAIQRKKALELYKV